MTLTYEDCKELKDAGFIMPERAWAEDIVYIKCLCNRTDAAHNPGADCFLFPPTLSELIEACGSSFHRLEQASESGRVNSGGANYWVASAQTGNGHIYTATTPEQAVKNLWLALNKK